ncbi:hypothetical protein [Kitasatospora sp. NPDC096140]|uniref:hypothetical protein n=1 Tax=Kitasatospora sp. NPDC096140 TaxID=3155425 RepID=UPI00331E4AD0
MAVREDTTQDVRHEPERHGRNGRHGRPRPFGGRLRLPTLRFSGAAMAMSTVVGISIATTLLLNEQQGIGRRAGVARVGSTPPPTPGATDQAEAVSASTPTAGPASGGPSAARQPAHPPTRPSAHPSGAAPVLATPTERSAHPGDPTGGRTAAGQDAQPSGTQLAGSEPSGQPGAPAPGGPSPVAPTPPTEQPVGGPTDDRPPNRPGLKPTGPTHPVPPTATDPGGDTGTATGAPGPTAPDPTAPAPTAPVPVVPDPVDPDPSADHALSGVALVSPLGRDGLRHELGLTVTESVTALQAEFRLVPGDSAAGPGTAWTDLPGAVVTVQQERGTLVYRFTTPPGTDVRPGHYTFGVRGARPAAADPSAVRKSAPTESWSASAFALGHPRAVATLGTFGPALPLPAAPRPPGTPAGPQVPAPR